MKITDCASLARCRVCLFMRTDVFMGARLGEKKAQSALPLFVFLSAKQGEKNKSSP